MNVMYWHYGYRDRLNRQGKPLKAWWFCDTAKMVPRDNLHRALGRIGCWILTLVSVIGLGMLINL